MVNFRYTIDMIKFVDISRSKGLTWKECSKEFNTKYMSAQTPNALRHMFREYSADLTDLSEQSENMVVNNFRAKASARDARNKLKNTVTAALTQQEFLEELKKISLKKQAPKKKTNAKKQPPKKKETKGKTPMTIELLLSDVQIGKKMKDYDSQVAKRRMQNYTEAAIFKIKQHIKLGYNVERIVLALLGDIIESSEKHPNSQRSTDCSTPEQMRLAVEYLYKDVILPLSELGIKMDVICVTGNHDHDDHKIKMFEPGREHLSWVFYNMLKMLAEQSGLEHVAFEIPIGIFTTTSIYGHRILYEHGTGIGTAEKAMLGRLNQRIRQLKQHITYFRMGDKHNICRYNEDTLVVNGAFFGNDDLGIEYSGINGYHACAGQIMFCYVPRKDERLPIFDSFIIQLQHVK